LSKSFEGVKRHRIRGEDGVFQLPLVVLLCEFTKPTLTQGPTVLEWHEVLTLFHEMGHAMHCEYLCTSAFCFDVDLNFFSNDRSDRVS
jgi:Zn-dependent oligopeptidase